MGVLAQHSPMIVLLRGGTVRVDQGGQVTDRLFVSGGFAEMTPARVTVLADEATPVAEVSRAEGEQRLAEAQADYAAADKMDMAALDRGDGPDAVGPRDDRGCRRLIGGGGCCRSATALPHRARSPLASRRSGDSAHPPRVEVLSCHRRRPAGVPRIGISRHEALADRRRCMGAIRPDTGRARDRAAGQGRGDGRAQRHRLRDLSQPRIPRRSGFPARSRSLVGRGGAARRRARPLGDAGRPRPGTTPPASPATAPATRCRWMPMRRCAARAPAS